ncbi:MULTISPECIES: S8 family serine peptidase [Idiomarina]|uniref:S8 family serine peptidase n=1 Tax=Idiomarina TaxID=135575 RepID=UPI0013897BB6|nr:MULTISPECIES: S8 family serine peptidase [Idiomarina]UUN14636.1 S8 family serine peptidase [Idiomarina loihiensis]
MDRSTYRMGGLARSLKLILTGVAAATVLTACGGSDDPEPITPPPPPPPPPASYTVTAEAGEGGSVAPTEQEVESGEQASIEVTADTGYDIDGVTGCGGDLAGTTYTTGAITEDCTVTASFIKKTYTVTTDVTEGGSWSPTEAIVEHGDSTSFVLTWDPVDYRILTTEGCEGSFADDTYTTGPITAACVVQAQLQFNEAPQCDAGDDTDANAGDRVSIEGTGSDDMEIVSWLWEQISGPEVVILDPASPTLEFDAPDVTEVTTLVFRLTVTDNEGKTATDEVTVTLYPVYPELTGVAMFAGDARAVGSTVTVYLDSSEDLRSINWQVTKRADASAVDFTAINDNAAIEFNVDDVGLYDVVATSHSGDSMQSMAVLTSSVPAPDPAALENYDGTTALDEVVAVVLNQSWVVSDTLTEAELTALITSDYSTLNPVAYDATQGLLVQYDADSILVREQLEMLKLQPNIASVNQRVHVGVNAEISFSTALPDDGDTWADGGSNWHLETEQGANFVEAWNTVTGNENVQIAVVDGGFYAEHEELQGRYSHLLTASQSAHGNGTAGAIVGASNNGVGVTGINHSSQAVLARWGVQSYAEALAQDDANDLRKIKVVNNSWGPMGNNSSSISMGIYFSRSYRQLALAHQDVLHVWAAGNDGRSATYQNGALHLNNNGSYSPLSNIMVVAAHGSDGLLLPYSNYGTSVDIAAPSEYLGVGAVNAGVSEYYASEDDSYGSCYSGGFNGTSAASPVVAGAASLIYSMYPGFTPTEVKQILVDSADTYVTQRHANAASCNGVPETVELPSPIPVLNVANAVAMAQDIINSKVTISHYMVNPFMNQVQFIMTSIDNNLAVQSFDWQLESLSAEQNWSVTDSGTGDVGIFAGMFDGDAQEHRLTVNVDLYDPQSDTIVNASRSYTFSLAQVFINTRDTVSLNAIGGAELQIANEAGQLYSFTGYSPESGITPAWLKPGSYSVYAEATDYQSSAVSFTVTTDEPQTIYLNMTTLDAGSVGSISGRVVNQNDEPVAGASVRISGGELTNGYFASAVTNSAGEYVISNISKVSSTGQPIESFTMEATASMHTTAVRDEVIVLAGLDRVENFRLNELEESEEVIFADSFENGPGEWSAVGMWHLESMTGNSLYNLLVDEGYVLFAPDEVADHAYLPQAYDGDYVWWYGKADTGTFIGEQASSDTLLSGGRSTSSNMGMLTSPVIDLSNTNQPMLDLQSWWEIESVNPNSSGFDLLRIQVSMNGDNFVTVRTLNPYVDPNDTQRAAKPFSSAGYNRKPVWTNELLDLSAYVGSQIQIRFQFATIDHLYNGFRGWVIDHVRVVDRYSEVVDPSIASGRVEHPDSAELLQQLRQPQWQPEQAQQAPVRDSMDGVQR